MLDRQAAKYLLRAVLFALVYAVLAKISLSIDAVGGFATLVWPATGLSLTAALLFGPTILPGVFAGALVGNLWSGAAPGAALGIAAGNTLEAAVGFYALRRIGFLATLERVRDVLALVLIGGIASSTVSSTIGVLSLRLAGQLPEGFAWTWQAWWIGDAISDLAFAPLLLLLGRARPFGRPIARWRIVEALALALALIAASILVFGSTGGSDAVHQPYWLLPLLLWGAVRFRQAGAAAAIFISAGAGALATILGRGPFAAQDLHVMLTELQVFIGLTAVSTLTLGAALGEQDLARRALRDSEVRKAAILDAALDAIVSVDAGGAVVELNPAAESLFGRARAESIGLPLASWFHPRSIETLRSLFDGSRVRDRRVEICAVRPDGTEIPVELSLTPIAVDGRELHIAFARDISERIRAERDLREYDQRLRAVIEGTTDAIYVKDREGRYLMINSAGAELLGRPPDQVIGSDDRALLPPGWAASVIAGDRQLIESAATLTVEEVLPLEGQPHIFSTIKAPYRDQNGLVIGLVGIARDITDQKNLYLKAKDAVRLRDEFLSIAGHELRTPLSVLVLQLESARRLVRATDDGEREAKLLSKLEGAGRQISRIATLVETVLDVSRISAGRLVLRLERFDLAEATRKVCDRFAEEAKNAAATLEVHADRGATGEWDRGRVEQVLASLLSNAIKYGAGKPVEVWVNHDEARARLIVRDHGIGVRQEDGERIFGRFERAVSARQYSGLGLGLYLSRHIAEAHGGSIAIEDGGGARSGATFVVDLPREPVV